ncbi:MAG: choice-of-anchor Q domain-containing protein [Kiritimatiellae bacterium]|nr:choice-of-anchor Q domain-containing protein [Kiritimatiellia bacterium]
MTIQQKTFTTNFSVWLFLLGLFCRTVTSFAAEHYVTPPGGYGANNPPYTNWADAATNIQWAVSAATNGETVYVTNGIYALTNQILITNGIILKSVNGYTNTTVLGNGSNRCFYVAGGIGGWPTIDGFTITNGYARSNDYSGNGGGLQVSSGNVYNCLITGNRTDNLSTNTIWGQGGGGGMNLEGGCTVLTCIIRGNYGRYGGGVHARDATICISNCIISENTAYLNGGGIMGLGFLKKSTIISNNASLQNGGGIYTTREMFITNSVVVENYAAGNGGGVALFNAFTMDNSSISQNVSKIDGGGVYLSSSSAYMAPEIRNSVIADNAASNSGGGLYFYNGGIAKQCLIEKNAIRPSSGSGCNGAGAYLLNIVNNTGYVVSCTIASNSGAQFGGGIAVSGTNNSYCVSNCIVWKNIATNTDGGNDIKDISGPTNRNAFNFTCASYTNFPPESWNITNDPQFVDITGGNYRLSANSPCVNSGSNQDWMTNSFDLDGRQRIRYGTVDMGAFEHIHGGSIYTFH